MEIGLGELRLAPDVFWGMTMHELLRAHDGYAQSHGAEEQEAAEIDGDKLQEILSDDG